jgi:predicted amidohydrolase YtcJ
MISTVIHVAPIVTMDPEQPRAEAMAVAGDRVIAVGPLADVRAAVPADTPELGLDGVVLPGLIDAHLHMQRGGLKAMSELTADADVVDFINTMRDRFAAPDWAGARPPTLEQRAHALRLVQPWLHALGFTGVVDPATTIEEMRGYQAARRRGELTMRTVAMPYPEVGSTATPNVDAVIGHLEGTGISTGFGDDVLAVGPVKIYLDGEALRGTALLERPWDSTSNYCGDQRISTDDYRRLVSWCAGHGWGVGTHAVGGGAVAIVAEAYAEAGSAVVDRRFQLIHAYLEPSADAITRAGAAGAVASLQPSIIWHNGSGLRARLGDRAETANPVRSWLDSGAVVAFGSDGPFFAFDPRHLMWQAITRRVAGEDQPLSSDEAVTVEECLAAYTTGAAYASLCEDRRGMLRAGYLADWALWSADPTSVPVDELRSLTVRRTDVGGRTVFLSPD